LTFTPIPRFGQDPGHLAAADQHVVRELQLRLEPGQRSDRLGAGAGRHAGQLGQALRRDRRPQLQRAEQARAGRREPAATEPPASGRLLVRRDQRSLGCFGRKQQLRGRCRSDVSVRVAEAAAQAGLDGLRRQ